MCTSEIWMTWNGSRPDETNFVGLAGAGFGKVTLKGVTGGGFVAMSVSGS